MARHKEFDQNLVLDEAMALFWHKGYEATSIQDLVNRMGISRGSLYGTFGDKHALFLAALDRYRQKSYDRFEQTLTQAASARAGITQLFRAIVEESLADPNKRGCLIVNSTVELAPHDKDTAECTALVRENIEEVLYQTLARAQADGEIPGKADTRALARFLFNGIQGLRVVAKTNPDRQVLEDIVRVTLSVLD